jgi:hypothetical protein
VRHAAITAAIATVLVLALSACAGSSEPESADEYPLVEQEKVEVRETVTTEGGGMASLLELPTSTEAEPSPTCERMAVAGGGRTIVVPPAPGLKAVAVTERTIRLEWSFEQLPEDCRPVTLLLAVNADSSATATPTVEELEIDGTSGSFELTYPDFLAPPDVARAAVYSEQGMSSRTTRVLIERES